MEFLFFRQLFQPVAPTNFVNGAWNAPYRATGLQHRRVDNSGKPLWSMLKQKKGQKILPIKPATGVMLVNRQVFVEDLTDLYNRMTKQGKYA